MPLLMNNCEVFKISTFYLVQSLMRLFFVMNTNMDQEQVNVTSTHLMLSFSFSKTKHVAV